MSYKRYSEYKDSGIEWIGEIPKEWSIVKLKTHYIFEKGKNAKLPIDADANGAYHIALKGLMALETLDSTGKVKISASNADWFRFVQEKKYRL